MEDNLKGKTKKGLYWSFFNQFSNYGMNFIVGIVMARLLSPSDFGITALPAVFMAIASTIQDGGLANALIRKKEVTNKDLSTTFYYSICLGVVLYLTLFLSAPLIADFYHTPILVSLIRVTAIGFLYSPLITPQNILLRRRLDFKTLTKISLVTRVFGATVGIVMAYVGYGVWSLVISNLLAGMFTLLIAWLVVRWLPKYGWSKESFKYLWGYGNKIMFSAIIENLYSNIAPVFIGKYYSPAQLGIYNRALGYASMPSQNITGAINNVSFPVLSKMQDDTEKLAYNYRRMLRLSAFVIFPIMLMLSALARPLVITMITEKWEHSIIFLQIMCFSMMWYPIHAINLNLLMVKGRSDLFFRLEIIKKITGISILLITLPMGLVPFCYGGIFSSMVALIINTYYTGKLIHIGYIKQMKDLLPIFSLSMFVWIVIHISNYFISNYIVQLIVGGSVGLIVYLGFAFLFRFDELNDVKYLLKRK